MAIEIIPTTRLFDDLIPTDSGTRTAPAPAATAGLFDDLVPAEESFGDVAKRRGQQFVRGMTEPLAALPEAAAISGASVDKTQTREAAEFRAERQETIDGIRQRLQEPDLDESVRAHLERNLADLELGQEELQRRAEAPVVPPRERPGYAKGQEIRESVAERFGTPDPTDQSFWAKLAEGAGNMTGFVAGSVATGPAAPLTGAYLGAAMNESQMYREAIEAGASEEDAQRAAKFGAVIGTTEIIPVSRALKLLPPRLRQTAGRVIWKRGADILQGAGEEAFQEYAAQVANNMVASGIYDPERGWTEGATEAAIIGGILGGGVGAIGTGVRGDAAPAAAAPRAPVTPEDVASPLPTELIAEGRALMQDATSGTERPSGATPAPPAPAPAPGPVAAPAAQREPALPETEEIDEIDADGTPTGRRVRVDYTTGAVEVVEAAQDRKNTPQNILENIPAPQPEETPVAETVAPDAEPPTRDVEAGQVEAPQPRRALGRDVEVLGSEEIAQVGTNPEAFQYKAGGDEQGVTDRLRGVEKWDSNRAGIALIYEHEDGRREIVDGHQRLGLAKRAAAAGQDVEMTVRVLREADGVTPQMARTLGAEKNIAEGSGTAMDTAKVFRDTRKTAKDLNLPPNSAIVRDGDALAKLSDQAFGMVVNEVAPTQYGAAVGRLVKDEAKHSDILGLLTRLQPRNAVETEAIVRQAMEAETTETQSTLFGEEEVSANLYLERARVLDRALKDIGADIRTFKTLTSRSEAIASEGNVLSDEANRARLDRDAMARQQLVSQANTKGPISDALTEAARRYKANPRDLGAAANDFVAAVRSREEVGAGGGAETGDAGPRAEGARAAEGGGQVDEGRVRQPAESRGGAVVQTRGRDNGEARARGRSAGGRDGGASLRTDASDRPRGDAAEGRRDEGTPDAVQDRSGRGGVGTATSPTPRGQETRSESIRARILRRAGGSIGYAEPSTKAEREALNALLREGLVVNAGRPQNSMTTRYRLAPQAERDQPGRASGAEAQELPRITRSEDMGADAFEDLLVSLKRAQPFDDLDGLLDHAERNHVALNDAAAEIARDMGMEFTAAPAKTRESAQRKVEQKYRGNAKLTTDAARAGVTVRTIEEADRFLDALSRRFRVVDEGWSVAPGGYFDRKVLVVFDDGQLGEFQMWPPGMFDAKEFRGGHRLYEVSRDATQPQDVRDQAVRDMEKLYGAVAESLDPSFAENLGLGAPRLESAASASSSDNSGARSSARIRERSREYQDRESRSQATASEPDTAASSVPSNRKNRTVMGDTSASDVDENGPEGNGPVTDIPYIEKEQAAWHGSPHVFDRFSLEHIGTGEGAQAYGWGLYFAGKREVAEFYRNALSRPEITFDGQELPDWMRQPHSSFDTVDKWRDLVASAPPDRPADVSAEVWDAAEQLVPFSLQSVLNRVRDRLWNGMSLEDALADVERTARLNLDSEITGDSTEAAARIGAVQFYRGRLRSNTGRLYRVEIPEDKDLLVWDRPLSEQPKGVQEKIRPLVERVAALPNKNGPVDRARDAVVDWSATGEQFYGRLVASERAAAYAEGVALTQEMTRSGAGWTAENLARHEDIRQREENADRAVSIALREAGIPGHRYLDHGSRNRWRVEYGEGQTAGYEEFSTREEAQELVDEMREAGDGNAKIVDNGSYNYVIYDDAQISIAEWEQATLGATLMPPNVAAEALPELRKALKRLALPRVRLDLDDPAKARQGAMRADRFGQIDILIGRSLDPKATLYHESIHAMRAMDLFTAEEWDALADAAMGGWLEKYDILRRYPDLLPSEQVEEAIAEEFGAWAAKKAKHSGFVQQAFAKIQRLMRAIREAFGAVGKPTAEDVFGKALAGEIGRRGAGNTGAMRGVEALGLETAQAGQETRTDTPEFRRWFGDSKVVDENGEPLVVYHGTGADFEAFNGMVWASSGLDLPADYASMRHETGAGNANIIPLFLRIERPFDADLGLPRAVTVGDMLTAAAEQAEAAGRTLDRERLSTILDRVRAGARQEESGPHYERHDFWYQPDWMFGRDGAAAIREMFEALGFDGIKMIEGGELTFGAFSPEQAKSVFNRGTWNPADPRILEQRRGKRDDSTPDLFAEQPGGRDRLKDQLEIDARQRQSKMRRLDQQRVEDDRDSLFGQSAPDLFREQRAPATMEDAADAIFRAIRDRAQEYEHLGLRVTEEALVPGEVVPPSRVWDNGDPTEELMDGASAVQISLDPFDPKPESVRVALETMLSEGYWGRHVSVIGSNKASSGVDQNEIILKEADVLATFERNGNMGEIVLEPSGRADKPGRFREQRLPSPQRQPHLATQMQGALFIPDRRIFDELGRGGASVWDRLKGGAAAAYDRADQVRILFQDRFLPVLRAQEAIERATGKPIPDEINAYVAEETFSGKVGRHLFEIDEQFTKPIIDLVAEGEIALADKDGKKRTGTDAVGLWLAARHAPERNARIARINPDMPDGGSGMTTAEAEKILAEARNGPNAERLDRIGQLIDQLRDRTLQLRQDAGLLTAQEAMVWKAYRHYVPLKGFAETDHTEATLDVTGVGRKFSIRGQESQRALGRRSEAFNPLQAAITQAQEVAVRAEKNRVGQVLHNLVSNFPSPAMWEVKEPAQRRYYNRATGMVETRVEDPVSLILKPNEMAVKIEGREHRIVFHDQRLAEALGTVGADQLSSIARAFAPFSRYFSAINTMLNPVFTVLNAARDMTAAQVNIRGFGGEDAKHISRAMVKNWPRAFMAATRGQLGREDSEWTRYYREFEESGAKVSFWKLEQPEAGKSDLDLRVRLKSGTALTQAGRLIRPSTRDNPALAFIERINLSVDNAVRLAAFVEARKRGWSKNKAASLSKNLTVNFNRRGRLSSDLNALFPFFNAAVQGTQVLFRAASYKPVRRSIYAMFLAGFVLDLVNAAISDEDEDGEKAYDKIPDWKHQRNAVFMTQQITGASTTVPLPYGYNAIFYAGTQLGKVARGVKGPGAAVNNWLGAAITAFSPISGRTFQEAITPTLLDPVNEMMMNEDWLGRPIRPENPYADFGPDAYKFFPGASLWARSVSDAANRLTGGSRAEPGRLDVSPEYLDHLFGFFAGGAGRFVSDTTDIATKAMLGRWDEIESRGVPFYTQLQYQTGEWLDRDRYYRFRERVREASEAAEVSQETGERLSPETARVAKLEAAMKAAEKRLREKRAQLRKIEESGTLNQSQKRNLRDAIRQSEVKVFLAFNELFRKAAGPQGE